jgi:DNA-binding MarR family transcriptional regulator
VSEPGPGAGLPLRRGAAPPPLNAAFLLISLGRMVREDVDDALRPLGLSMRHLSALGHLSHQPGMSYSELARRAGITPQSMQATLQQLEQLQAVERRTVAGRGRTARLHVTEIGRDLLRQGQGVIQTAEGALLADVPADQQGAFSAGLASAFAAAIRRRME